MKHFDEPSCYGINNGRISKATIKRNGEEVCNYNRGWDIEPVDNDLKMALAILMKSYN